MSLTKELEKVGMTKTELAEALGVSRKTIQRMGEEITPEVKRILNMSKEPPYEWLDIPLSKFDGKGRGTPVDGFVMVSRGWIQDEGETKVLQGVVSEKAWRERMDWTCKHGLEGWSCKRCLKS